MRLLFLLARRVPPVPSPILTDVIDGLGRRGHRIDCVIAEDVVLAPESLPSGYDLYLLKSHTELSLSLAGILHARGERLLNPYPSCLATQNKIVAYQRLSAAGIPLPRSWITGDLELLRPIVDSGVELIIKPYLGHRGAGIRLVRNPHQLAETPPPAGPMLVQEFVTGDGEDLKVYVIGDRVAGVRKPFSPMSFTKFGRACDIPPAVQRIALRCGRAFGLGLYGLDIVATADGPVVVDLNFFPGYKGVPEAAAGITDYIDAYAGGAFRLRLPRLEEIEREQRLVTVATDRSGADEGQP